MGQEWSEILQEGSFGGVKFDFVSVRDDYSNDTDQQKFPGAKGTKIIARGRNSARHEILAVIIEDDYPDKMYDLINQLDDGGQVKAFVHPIFGETRAACERFTVNHDAEDARDSCTISITLVEDLIEDLDLVSRTNTTPAQANAVRSLADDTTAELDTFQESLDTPDVDIGLAVADAVSASVAIADTLEATFEDLSTLAIQTTANGGLTKCDEAIALLDDYTSTEQYDLAAALREMASALRDMAQALIEARPPLSVLAIAADTNLLALAHALGDDPEELLALNSFPDPSLIPAGFKIMRYAD